MSDDCLDFLKDDYKWKVDYLSNHFARMWTRFNFFLVLQSALSGAIWIWFKDKGLFVGAAAPLAMVGLATGLVWYALGAQDRRLAAVYQQEIRCVAEDIDRRMNLSGYLGRPYVHVGDQYQPLDQPWYASFYQWRLEPISSTKLAAWFPLLAVGYWIVLLAMTLKGPVSA